jgi:hypothetical protein
MATLRCSVLQPSKGRKLLLAPIKQERELAMSYAQHATCAVRIRGLCLDTYSITSLALSAVTQWLPDDISQHHDACSYVNKTL